MNILAMKGPSGSKGAAQLWIVGKVEYATLVVNQFPSYKVKLCLTSDDRNNLRLTLKKWGNLGKDWDPSNVESIVNFSTRPDKVEELIELITGNEVVQDTVKAIHYHDTFPFTYDVRKTTDMDADYPDPGHDVDDFKNGSKVAIEFQVVSRNFRASKRVECRKGILIPTIRSLSDRGPRSIDGVDTGQTSTG